MIAAPIDQRTAYLIRNVHILQQHQEPKYPPDSLVDGDPALVFGWDWQVEDETEEIFTVAITVGFDASKPRPEETRVVVVGEFEFQVGDNESGLPFDKFVEQNAPAILFPYARSAIASLTAHSPLGTYLLPPVNVVALMAHQDTGAATGVKQLRSNPELAQRLGWPEA